MSKRFVFTGQTLFVHFQGATVWTVFTFTYFFLFLSELRKFVSKPHSSRKWKCFFLSGSSILFLINGNIHLIKLNHFPKHHHEWLKCLSSISKDKTTGKECADELKGIDDIAKFQQILRRSSQVYWLIDYSLIVSPPRHGPFDLRYSQSAFSSWLHGWKNVQSLQTRLFSSLLWTLVLC